MKGEGEGFSWRCVGYPSEGVHVASNVLKALRARASPPLTRDGVVPYVGLFTNAERQHARCIGRMAARETHKEKVVRQSTQVRRACACGHAHSARYASAGLCVRLTSQVYGFDEDTLEAAKACAVREHARGVVLSLLLRCVRWEGCESLFRHVLARCAGTFAPCPEPFAERRFTQAPARATAAFARLAACWKESSKAVRTIGRFAKLATFRLANVAPR